MNAMAHLVLDIAGKSDLPVSIKHWLHLRFSNSSFGFFSPVQLRHVTGPQGVRGRNSNNDLIREKLNWEPKIALKDGLALT